MVHLLGKPLHELVGVSTRPRVAIGLLANPLLQNPIYWSLYGIIVTQLGGAQQPMLTGSSPPICSCLPEWPIAIFSHVCVLCYVLAADVDQSLDLGPGTTPTTVNQVGLQLNLFVSWNHIHDCCASCLSFAVQYLNDTYGYKHDFEGWVALIMIGKTPLTSCLHLFACPAIIPAFECFCCQQVMESHLLSSLWLPCNS